MEVLKSTYCFETKAQAKKFRQEMLKACFLTKYERDYVVSLYWFDKMEVGAQVVASRTADRVYRKIMK